MDLTLFRVPIYSSARLGGRQITARCASTGTTKPHPFFSFFSSARLGGRQNGGSGGGGKVWLLIGGCAVGVGLKRAQFPARHAGYGVGSAGPSLTLPARSRHSLGRRTLFYGAPISANILTLLAALPGAHIFPITASPNSEHLSNFAFVPSASISRCKSYVTVFAVIAPSMPLRIASAASVQPR